MNLANMIRIFDLSSGDSSGCFIAKTHDCKGVFLCVHASLQEMNDPGRSRAG
jgi:hypothetical protein